MGHVVNRGTAIIIVTSIALGFTSVAILLRCYVRIGIQKKFSADDYIILFSQACFVAFAFLLYRDVKYDAGKHVVDILMSHPEHIHKVVQSWWLAHQAFLASTASAKLSIAIFFCSLKPPAKLKAVAIITACVAIGVALATSLFQIFECWPVHYFWTRFSFNNSQGSCLSDFTTYTVFQAMNALDILADIILAVLPGIMVRNLQIKRSERYCLSVLLGLSALPAVAAIIRADHFNVLLDISDFTYTSFPVGITSTAEPAIGITVICIARLRPLIKIFLPISSSSGSPNSSGQQPLTIGRRGRYPHDNVDTSVHEGSVDQEPNLIIHTGFPSEPTRPAPISQVSDNFVFIHHVA